MTQPNTPEIAEILWTFKVAVDNGVDLTSEPPEVEATAHLELLLIEGRLEESKHTFYCEHFDPTKNHLEYRVEGQKPGEGLSKDDRLAELQAQRDKIKEAI